MKEKVKHILGLIQTKKFKTIVLIFSIFIVLLYSSLYLYSSVYEPEKMDMDRYNFNQLNQIKPILKRLDMWSIWFRYIWDFNKIYHANIKPIKNCYYISDENWDYPYIFWFQLESLFYKFLHFWENYAYPTYDIPKQRQCFGLLINWATGGCKVIWKEIFIDKISKPCDKYELK